MDARKIANELLIKNSDKLKPEDVKSLKEIKDGRKFLKKILEKVLSKDSLNLLNYISVIEDKIDRMAAREVYGKIFGGIDGLFRELVNAHLLEEHKSKFVFLFKQLKDELQDGESIHAIAMLYYSKKLEIYGRNRDDLIKIILHGLKAGDLKRSLDIFIELCNEKEDAELINIGEKLLDAADEREKGAVLRALGSLCFETMPSKAEKYYREAIDVYMELSHKNPEVYMPELARTFKVLGGLYCTLKKSEQAEEHFKWAATIFSKLNLLKDLAITLDNLGILYLNNGKFNEAEEALKEALELKRGHLTKENMPDLAMTLNNLGVLYRNLKKPNEVEKYYKEALGIFRELAAENDEFVSHLAGALNNLGTLYIEMDRTKEGLKLAEEALKHEPKLPLELKAKCYLTIGRGYERIGDEKAKGKAAECYMRVASISYLLFRQLGIQSLNFVHLLEKVEGLASGELRGDAILMKAAILRIYYRLNVEFKEVECSKRGKLILKALRGEEIKDFSVGGEEDMAAYLIASDASRL